MTVDTRTAVLLDPAVERRAPRRRRIDWGSLCYVAPALLVFVIFVAVPIGISLQYSFYDYNGLTVGRPVGLDNYVSVFTDPELRSALGHALLLVVFYSLIPVAIGLVLAGLMSRIKVFALPLFRALLFLPQVLATVVIAIAWRKMYGLEGPLNSVLSFFGLGSLTTDWLGNYTTALPAIGLVGTWFESGLCMVLFLSGIALIDNSVYEAASLDGAGPVRSFFAITVPALRPQISIALILTITFALRNFDIVWNTTRGGPGSTTTVPSLFVYLDAFQNRNLGQASSLAVVMTLATVTVVGTVRWLLRDKDA
ncbi:carbohydrate ABC transporter permease [Streptomyces shenzhenensis]|uniref:carbohydrate ABC transporter permease n=1 Tax=Streptomyces shenzhenensis TaxID=943815 RepID=UPI003D8C23BC